MSMISSQCDELRNLALWLDDEFYDAEASKVRQAADTIWELRCKLVDMVDQRDEIERLKAENAKLRELVAWMYRLMDKSCAVQHPYAPEPIRYGTLLDVHEKLRELRIEADG